MISSHSKQNNSNLPDLTPLLDLIFIVMVFLLLTTNVHLETMEINIPQTDQSDVLNPIDKPTINIHILKGEQPWGLNGKPFTQWPDFTNALLSTIKNNPKKTLIISADKDANIESMLKLLAFLQNNQIQTTNIIMEDSSS